MIDDPGQARLNSACAATSESGTPDPYRLLDSLPLSHIEHFGRPLSTHLRGTHDLLQRWGNPASVCLAGLLHSVYGTLTFQHAVLDLAQRAAVQARIGKEAEQLVYLFCAGDRKRLLLENDRPPYKWIDHRNGVSRVLPRDTLRALVEIEAANYLEQLHRVNAASVLEDMQARFEASAHHLSELARRALFSELAVNGFKRCGCGVARGLLDRDEIDRLQHEAMSLWQRFRTDGASNLRVGVRTDDAGGLVLERLDPVSDISAVFASLNQHESLLEIARAGLGGPVTVMKEKLIFKWPGTPGFGPHRDGDYNSQRTGVPGSEALTICLALVLANRDNGALELFPSLQKTRLAAPPDEHRDIAESELEGVDSLMPVLQPGDAVVFDGQVPHRSGSNRGDTPRLTYMVTYVPGKFGEARRDYYQAILGERREQRSHVLTQPAFFE
jgi:hypothetical protein